MVTNGVWMDTGGREDTGRQENESHVGARRDTRGENVYPLATDGQRKFPMWVAKKNLTKRGGQGWLSVGVQASKAGKRERENENEHTHTCGREREREACKRENERTRE